MDSYVHGKPLWDGIVAWYAFPNAYQTIIPSHINLQCTTESCSASTHAYNHALVSDSALPNLTSKFASAFSNAYQTTIPSQINLPCTDESGSASTHAYNHALVSDSALPNLTSSFTYAFPNAY